MPIPVIVAVAAVAAPVVMGSIASAKASAAADDAELEKEALKTQLENLENARQPIVNPYANIPVATQAANLKLEQADSTLATTLDTLQAMGGSGASATALAREANKAKLQIAAEIEKQEVEVNKLQAEGEKQKLNRTAGLLDRATMQEMQYRSDSLAALTGGVTGGTSTAASIDWSNVGMG
jgi:hypothetical protein